MARGYMQPKHAWRFMERGEQPVPVCGEDGYHLVCGDWSSKIGWVAWLRKEIRELAAKSQAHGEALGAAGAAARKRRRTWSVEAQRTE